MFPVILRCDARRLRASSAKGVGASPSAPHLLSGRHLPPRSALAHYVSRSSLSFVDRHVLDPGRLKLALQRLKRAALGLDWLHFRGRLCGRRRERPRFAA